MPLAVASGNLVRFGNFYSHDSFLPSDATDLIAVSPGLGLRADGTVIAWGRNDYGQTNVPAGLSNVVSIASGETFRLALRSDGNVVGWGKRFRPNYLVGYNDPVSPPEGISNVVAMTTSVFLHSDGTVSSWGFGGPGPAPDLTNVIAVASSSSIGFAVKNDGTVVGWGIPPRDPIDDNEDTQLQIPAEATNITKVATSGYHVLALSSNGTVLAWGDNLDGQCNVPVGLSDVVDIVASYGYSLALKSDGTLVQWPTNAFSPPPTLPANVIAICQGDPRLAITTMPVVYPSRLIVLTNTPVTMEVHFPGDVTDARYQWYSEPANSYGSTKVPIAGATNRILTLPSITGAKHFTAELIIGEAVFPSVSNLAIPVTPTMIESATVDSNGFLDLTFNTFCPGLHIIESSTNLVNWTFEGSIWWYDNQWQFHWDEVYVGPSKFRYFRTLQVD